VPDPDLNERAAPRLSLRLLGGVQATLDGKPLDGFESDLVRALLAYLAVERDRPHRREALAALFWPEQPDPIASHRLRQTLSNLRQVLRDGAAATPLLLVTNHDVQLNPAAAVRLDVNDLANQLAACQGHRHRQLATCRLCLRRLNEAVALYPGPFLAGFAPAGSAPFQDWATAVGERLHQQVVEALLILAAAQERRGGFAEAAQLARRALQLEPWNEPAQRQLMRALALGGQRAAALRQFQVGRRVLAKELGVKPAKETMALYVQIRDGEYAAAGELQRPRQNLPLALSSFVGRETETAEIQDLLAAERLVTLTGVGGSGKTRLALHAAEGMVESFPDGVWLSEFAPLAEPGLVISGVAEVLGLRDQTEQSLQDYLRSRETLLILDNCEHLIGACAHLAATLLGACPRLTILATSRQSLQVRGERVVPVPPLRLPDRDEVQPVARFLEVDAVRLFVERAQAIQPGFALAEPTARAVAEICRRLDGLPLAIELAAAWSSVLTPAALLERLASGSSLLSGGARDLPARQQTLRATISWSYDLLEPAEQALFRRLAVFAGGFSLEAAEAVAEGEDVLPLLARLVEKSLVVAQVQDGRPRYHLLETLRQFGWERLVEAGESDDACDRLRGWCLSLGTSDFSQPGFDERAWGDRIALEHDNVRAALAWCLDHDPPSVLQLAQNMSRFWAMRGSRNEGRRWLDAALVRATTTSRLRARALQSVAEEAEDQGDYRIRASRAAEGLAVSREIGDVVEASRAIRTLGCLAAQQGDYARGRVLHQEGLILARQGDNEAAYCSNLWGLAELEWWEGDYERARLAIEEFLAIARKRSDAVIIGWGLAILGAIPCSAGDTGGGQALLAEGLARHREGGDKPGLGWALAHLGYVLGRTGDAGQASALLRESLLLFQEVGHRPRAARSLCFLGILSTLPGDYSCSARLIGAAERINHYLRASLALDQRAACEKALATARTALGDAAFGRIWAEGQAMTLEEAVAYALAEDDE
jgi:predicted ATPase/DNA-binding SARP family transcriptional activator